MNVRVHWRCSAATVAVVTLTLQVVAVLPAELPMHLPAAAVVMPAELRGLPLAAAVVMPAELRRHPLAAAVAMQAELRGHPLAAAASDQTVPATAVTASLEVVLRQPLPSAVVAVDAVIAWWPTAARLVVLVAAALLVLQLVAAAALQMLQLVAAAALLVLELVAAAGRVTPAFGGRRGLPLQQRQSCWMNVTVL